MREEWYGNNYFRKNYKYLEVSMQLKINNEKKELKFHGSYEFPVFVSHEVLSDYERGAFAWYIALRQEKDFFAMQMHFTLVIC